jgi:hypothetical protein
MLLLWGGFPGVGAQPVPVGVLLLLFSIEMCRGVLKGAGQGRVWLLQGHELVCE